MNRPLGRHLPHLVEETEEEELLCCWVDEDESWWRIDVIDGITVTYCYNLPGWSTELPITNAWTLSTQATKEVVAEVKGESAEGPTATLRTLWWNL